MNKVTCPLKKSRFSGHSNYDRRSKGGSQVTSLQSDSVCIGRRSGVEGQVNKTSEFSTGDSCLFPVSNRQSRLFKAVFLFF